MGLDIHEPSYSALIRSYCANSLPLKALDLFHQLEAVGLTPKHRTCTPLLDALSKGHHMALAFELFNRMGEKYELIPQEKDYTRYNHMRIYNDHFYAECDCLYSMLRLCHEMRDPRFQSILDSMMEDILVPISEETIEVLR